MIRLDKFLCDCNYGTRSEVKKLIKTGAVQVNQQVIKDPNYKFDELTVVVNVHGKKVDYEKFGYYLFHKPQNTVTANSDALHRTVMDYMPKELQKNFFPVGRLDLDTEGLLLITNDGELAHHLLSPSHHVDKTYYALLSSPLNKSAIALVEQGIDIGDDTLTLPAKLELSEDVICYKNQNCYPATITIREGRFHQVKRMFHALGSEVVYLKRLSMGSVALGDLPLGEYRKLTEEEVNKLKNS